MAGDIPFTLTNTDGADHYVAELASGDTDTEVLFIDPTNRDVSIFIRNPNNDTIQMLASNLPKEEITLADLVQVGCDIKGDYANGLNTAITAIAFVGPVTAEVKISVLQRKR